MKTELLPVNPPLTPPRRGTAKACPAACSPPLEGLGAGLVFRIATPETNLLWLLIAVLLSTTAQFVPAATNDLSSALQKGLFEEEANRNLDAAISAYQSLVGVFDKDRKIAATAVFRLGEVYRKLGRTNEAAAQYGRIVQEFSDQTTLVTLSRQNLTGLGAASSVSAKDLAQTSSQPRIAELQATLVYRQTLLEKLKPLSVEELKQVLPTMMPDSMLNELLQNESLGQQKLAKLRNSVAESHPDYVQASAILKHVQEQIKNRVVGMMKSMEVQIAATKAESETLSKQTSAVQTSSQSNLADLQAQSARLQALLTKLKALSLEELEQALPTTVPDTALAELSMHKSNTEQKLASLKADLSQDNPMIIQADTVLKVIKVQIKERVSGIMNALELQSAARKAELEALSKQTETPLSQTPAPAASNPEEQEIRRIQAMIQNSPDLINAPRKGSTPLIDAANAGQLRVAAFLLDHGADVNLKSGNLNPLLVAAVNGNKAMVELLLGRGADINAKDGGGRTALHTAAASGFVSVVETLLQHKADVNARDSERNGQQTPLHLAAAGGHPAIVKLLVANGADVNGKSLGGVTPLLQAAAGGHRDTAAALLDAKADVNVASNDGSTPLHAAAEAGHLEVVKLLLECKAEVNTRNERQATPLLLAVSNQHTAVVKTLLENGANPDLSGSLVVRDRNWSGQPIYLSIARKNTEILALLLEHGADPDGTETTGWRPLLQAIQDNNVQAVELLLAHKAYPNKPDSEGNPPLLKGIQNAEIVRLLLEAGADANARDKDGLPALIQATRSDSPAILKLLFDHKADVNVAAPDGWTALHCASAYGKLEMVELLLAHKAEVNARDRDGTTPLDLAKRNANKNQLQGPSGIVSYQWRAVSSGGSATNEPPSMEDLLRQHGALDDLPDFTTIRVTRQGLEKPIAIFRAHTNGWNRFTLLETVTGFYSRDVRGFVVGADAPFPDLSRIIIHRPARAAGGKSQEIKVSLLGATNGVDCTKDMPLEFGDVVEIPARDYTLNEAQVGLTREQQDAVAGCLQRRVRLVVRAQTREVAVLPRSSNDAWLKVLLQRPEAKSLLLSSSDLSRVKVTRKNPATGKATEIIVNTSGSDTSGDLWLLDGDVIEVPEK